MPRLENWRIVGDCLEGEIFEDPQIPSGERITTRRVITLNADMGWADTEDKLYFLGKKGQS
jgi:hypothetical protein